MDRDFFKNIFQHVRRRSFGVWIIAVLFLIAVISRLIFVFDVASQPLLSQSLPKTDPFNYDLHARNLLRGEPLNLRMPGYPLLIGYFANVYRILGTEPVRFYLFQLLVSLASTFFLILTGRMIFGWGPGLLAGLIYIFYKMNFVYDVLKVETNLSQFLIIGTLYFFVAHLKQPTFKNWLGGAIFGVLLCLSRVFFWFIMLPAWISIFIRYRYWRDWRHLLLYTLLCLAAGSLFFAMHSSDRYSHKFGVHFFLGSSARSLGLMQRMADIRPTSEGFAKDSILVAARETGSTDNLNAYWIKRTFDSWSEMPGRTLKMWARKINYLVNHYEPHNNTSVYYYEKNTLLGRLSRIDFSLIVTMAAVGIFAAFWRRHEGLYLLLPLGFLTVMVMLVFICSRYRMPLIPFMSLYAGFGAMSLWEAARQTKFYWLGSLMLVGILFLGWSRVHLHPFDKERDIRHWERKDKSRLARQKFVENALTDLRRWEQFNLAQKVNLVIRLERLGLKFEFDRVYAETLRLAEATGDHRMVARLLERRAAFYESNFDFRSALEIWQRLAEFPPFRERATEKVKEINMIGPLLDTDF